MDTSIKPNPKLFSTEAVSLSGIGHEVLMPYTDVTLRDVFAAVACFALIVKGNAGAKYIGRAAYEYADELLGARVAKEVPE